MDLKKIAALIKTGESQHVEFKKSTIQLKAAFETICAFLNDNGGVVLIGVSNSGQIVGQNITDNTRQEIAREIKKIEPKPHIAIHYVAVTPEKQVIAIEVKSGQHIVMHFSSSQLRLTSHNVIYPLQVILYLIECNVLTNQLCPT